MNSAVGVAPRRRRRREVSTRQYLSMLERMIGAAGRRVGEDADGSLRELVELHGALDEAIVEAVAGLRDAGVTWQEIGDWVGTTRQAAIMRWNGHL